MLDQGRPNLDTGGVHVNELEPGVAVELLTDNEWVAARFTFQSKDGRLTFRRTHHVTGHPPFVSIPSDRLGEFVRWPESRDLTTVEE